MGCFYILIIVSNVAGKIGVHESFQNTVLFLNTRSKIAGSYAGFIFNPFKKLQNIFHSSCTNLYSQQQCKEFPFLHILTNTWFCYLLNDSHLDRCRWYLIVVLICISLMISDTEHIFTCYWSSSLEKFYSGPMSTINYLFIFMLRCRSLVYFWIIIFYETICKKVLQIAFSIK